MSKSYPNKYALITKEEYESIVGLYRLNDAIFSPDLKQVVIEINDDRFNAILISNKIDAKLMDHDEAQKFIRNGWKKPSLRIKAKNNEE